MGLEEHSIEDLAPKCAECGAKLTEAEQADILEAEGPNLCRMCADESGSEEELAAV